MKYQKKELIVKSTIEIKHEEKHHDEHLAEAREEKNLEGHTISTIKAH